jgi:hypothetical protein
MSTNKKTTNHEEIRLWAESRNAKPACVAGEQGLIRLDYPGYNGLGPLEHISWDAFFEKFDEEGLAMVYAEAEPDGHHGASVKLVRRDGYHRGN